MGLRALADRRPGSDHEGMAPPERSPLPPGRQPWDPVNGLRIGILVGGLLAAGVIALTGFTHLWVIVVGGIVGGAIGYFSQKPPG